MSKTIIDQVRLSALIQRHYDIPSNEIKIILDKILDEIALEVSKGTQIVIPGGFTITPVIKEAGTISVPYLQTPVYKDASIGMRLKTSTILLGKIKSYKLDNLNLY